MSESTSERGFTTAILHGDRASPIEHGALHKPLHLSVAYGYSRAEDLVAVFQGRQSGYAYGRQGNPTTAALEAKVTAMEGGLATVCFTTGMAAIEATLLALLRNGDHVVSSSFVFGNTNSLLETLGRHGTPVTFVDATSATNVERALTPATKLVFVETIANPRTQVADLEGIGALCRARGILYVVDNTMTSPWLFRPASVGAGLVVNALTKYIGGHGNALGGAVTDTGQFDWTRFPNIAESYRRQPPALQGITQIRKKGLRDGGAIAPRARARGAALPRPRRIVVVRARARPRRARVSRSTARRRAVVEPRRQPHARDPRGAHDLLGNGTGAPRRDGHRRFADPHLGRHRGSRRPARRFPSGARLIATGCIAAAPGAYFAPSLEGGRHGEPRQAAQGTEETETAEEA